MKKQRLSVVLSLFFLGLLVGFNSCKKINEATLLGGDLIPAVDNVNTFDTILTVNAFNEAFTLTNDSTRILPGDELYLGHISSDPLFGKTTGTIFFELKPATNKYSFTGTNRRIDSIVLVMNYRQTYGDTNIPQRIQVYEIDQSNTFSANQFYPILGTNFTYSNLLGTKVITPKELNDSVTAFREKGANQLRIRLNNSFGQTLLSKDSTNAFESDSAFRTFFKGFAVTPDVAFGGNAVMGFQLSDTNTKLAIYYKFDVDGRTDTSAVATFGFVGNNGFASNPSALANKVERNYTGAQVSSFLGGTTPDNLIFIQTTPGTYANLRIPGLATLSNRVVHRAELIVEQVTDNSDRLFPPPELLYLDAYDPSLDSFRAIPYDFSISSTGQYNFNAFGSFGENSFSNGGPIKKWRFNVSRYVQNIVNGKQQAFDLRLSAPLSAINVFRNELNGAQITQGVGVNTTTTRGRVRLGGTNHPTQPIRLRIVYSKL